MALFDRGRRLEVLPARTRKLVVLVHGMAHTERCWAFADDPAADYGRLLEAELGFTPLYLRYNTGRPIWENGQDLALLLEGVVQAAPEPAEEIILIGHSLGGLVLRSACHHAQDKAWAPLVSRIFYLGSPHQGSPWERLGRQTTRLLQAIPDPVTRLVGEVTDLRGVAVKSLGDGRIARDGRRVPLDPRFEHFFVAGAVGWKWIARFVGDGLVPFSSAAELAGPGDRAVGFFPGVAHMTLARDREVYAWIAERCRAHETGGKDRPGAEAPRRPVVSGEEAAEGGGAPWRSPEPAPRTAAGLVALVAEGVEAGAPAVGRVHEEIASRPYAMLEAVPGLAEPTRAVRAVHFGLLRGTYEAVRWTGARVRAAATHPKHNPAARDRCRDRELDRVPQASSAGSA
jgi:hypothetical protein